MKVIRPTEINDGNLTASDVSASSVQEWEFDKAYAIGARVVRSYGGQFTSRAVSLPDAISNYEDIVSNGGDVIIAVGVAGIAQRSLDSGVTWSPVTLPNSNDFTGIAYGGGTFVAVSRDGTNRSIYSTDDGASWTETTPTANQWQSITYGDSVGLFVAVSQSGSGNRVETSPDGVNWTSRSSSANELWQSVTWSEELTLFCAVAALEATNGVMTSPDGVNWTNRVPSESAQWNQVVWGDGVFVAIASTGTNRVMTSPDGVNWIGRSDFSGANGWKGIAYGNGEFIATGTFGSPRIMRSLDRGVSWAAMDEPEETIQGWNAICHTGGLFIAIENGLSKILGTRGVHSIYESTANLNTRNYPEDDNILEPVNWARVSATNKHAMFSDQLNDQTARSSIEIEVTPGVEIDAVAFFNVDCETIQIVVDDGAEQYNEIYTLEENFLLPGIRQDTLAVLDLPAGFPDAVITFTFENTSGDAKVGRMTIGNQQNLGDSNTGSSVGIVDFSKKERDTFGNPIIIPRNDAKRGDFTVFVDTVNVSAIHQFLSLIRTTPSAFIADDATPATIIYGFYKDFSINLDTTKSVLTIEIEGLT